MTKVEFSSVQGEAADAFVSYSHRDQEWVRTLVARLNNEVIDGRQLRVVIDEVAFIPGQSLVESIERGVRTGRKLVCVLSPDFVASDWTALEYQMKMLDDPAGRKGLIVPILYRDCDVPYSLRVRIAADFRRKENQEGAYRRLRLALGAGPRSGLGSASPQARPMQLAYPSMDEPDPILETLSLNAFRVLHRPERVWHANTPFRTPREVLETMGRSVREAFVLSSGKIWTLSNLRVKGNRLRKAVVRDTISSTPFRDVFQSNRNLTIQLLNRCLVTHLKRQDIWFDGRYERFYFPARFGDARSVEWPGLKKSTKRTVATPHLRAGQIAYFRHLAAIMRFSVIDGELCLAVLPTRIVTENGYDPKRGPGVGRIVGRLTRNIYNREFWLDVMFWLHQLHKEGRILIGMGDTKIEIEPNPLSTAVGHGIFGDRASMFGGDFVERWHSLAPALEGAEEEEEGEDGEEAQEDIE